MNADVNQIIFLEKIITWLLMGIGLIIGWIVIYRKELFNKEEKEE